MSTVFGPVPSRRLGRSLGVDLTPLKTCNWNCVYCQLGRTKRLCTVRQEFLPRRAVLQEIEQALAEQPPGALDWLTFVGAGEPTLHSGLGWLLSETRRRTNLPLAVITNGALLTDPAVRDELCQADAVLPSLDAGSPRLYRRIQRPPAAMRFEFHVEGLLRFRRQFAGRLWVEVMLLQGVNDTEPALHALATCLDSISPDEIHLMLPLRPPAEAWVRPSDAQGVRRALELLGPRARSPSQPGGRVSLDTRLNLPAAILEILTRHPVEEAELQACADGHTPGEVTAALGCLQAAGTACPLEYEGRRVWRATHGS